MTRRTLVTLRTIFAVWCAVCLALTVGNTVEGHGVGAVCGAVGAVFAAILASHTAREIEKREAQ